jgi:hypothetical protein
VCKESGVRALTNHYDGLRLRFKEALQGSPLQPGDEVVVSGGEAGCILVQHSHGRAVIVPFGESGWLGEELDTLRTLLPAESACTAELAPYLAIATITAEVVEGLGLEVDARRGRMGVGGTFMAIVRDKYQSTYSVKVRVATGTAAHMSSGGDGLFLMHMHNGGRFEWQVLQQDGTRDGGWRTKGAPATVGVDYGHAVFPLLVKLNKSVRRGLGVTAGKWALMEMAMHKLAHEQTQGVAQNESAEDAADRIGAQLVAEELHAVETKAAARQNRAAFRRNVKTCKRVDNMTDGEREEAQEAYHKENMHHPSDVDEWKFQQQHQEAWRLPGIYRRKLPGNAPNGMIGDLSQIPSDLFEGGGHAGDESNSNDSSTKRGAFTAEMSNRSESRYGKPDGQDDDDTVTRRG